MRSLAGERMLGVYWQPEGDWSFGASYKSTQWFERYTFNSVNPTNGNPASPNFALNFPETVSAGFAYKGIDRLLLATDFRFLDYRDTSGFSQSGTKSTCWRSRSADWAGRASSPWDRGISNKRVR